MATGASKTIASDEELMGLVQSADDRDAFACLYDRYAHNALQVARSICASYTRSEEIVQEGFLAIWRSRSRFNSSAGDSFGAWSMTIVRYVAIDAIRHDTAGKRPEFAAEQTETVDSKAPPPEDQVIARQEAEALHATLAELPEAQAKVIRLAFFGELTHAEIAEHLSLPPGTVKGRMRLGLEKLRSGIEHDS